MERGPVLPLRFGSRLDSEDELATALRERQQSLKRSLDRVRGRVELGVRVLDEGDAPPRGGARSGRDYLLGRVAAHRRSEQAAREVHEPLTELAAASQRSDQPAPPAILVGSYLVDEAEVEAFRERAEALGQSQEEVRVVVTGPWAPYSFADEEPG
jgi:hypothetical protein